MKSLKMKDVITVALLSALYIILYSVAMGIIFLVGPLGQAISPGIAGFIAGSVILFMVRKVGKMFQFTLMSAIFMGLSALMGGGYLPWLITTMVTAVIADLIVIKGKEASVLSVAIASGVMHMGQAWGAIVPCWFFLESFKKDWIGRSGMTAEAMENYVNYLQGGMGVIASIVTFLLAFAGVFIGNLILKKHLEKNKA